MEDGVYRMEDGGWRTVKFCSKQTAANGNSKVRRTDWELTRLFVVQSDKGLPLPSNCAGAGAGGVSATSTFRYTGAKC